MTRDWTARLLALAALVLAGAHFAYALGYARGEHLAAERFTGQLALKGGLGTARVPLGWTCTCKSDRPESIRCETVHRMLIATASADDHVMDGADHLVDFWCAP